MVSMARYPIRSDPDWLFEEALPHMSTSAPPEARTGVLLVNLGTPDAPRTAEVRRYLREFLFDPAVIDIPAIPRWLLLNLIILPVRPRRSAEAYAKIWTPEGSPLLVHGRKLRDGVAARLPVPVALGMRYGSPSLGDGLDALVAEGVTRVVVLPLYPQYATASTGSTDVKIGKEARARGLTTTSLPEFYDDPGFIRAFAEVGRAELADFRPDHVLFSYHGLPERQILPLVPANSPCLREAGCCDRIDDRNRRCYRAQCFATTRLLVAALDLDPAMTTTTFQSRLGSNKWIDPYTDVVLPQLASGGKRRMLVFSPAFVADCLETLEEIAIRGRDDFRAAGGEDLRLVPSLNATPTWMDAVADLLRPHIA